MILTSHLLTGAAITTKVTNPFLSLPLAILSHYLLDTLPHRDYRFNNRKNTKRILKERSWQDLKSNFFRFFLDGFLIILDGIFGLIVIFLIFSGKSLPPFFWLVIFGTILPDLLASLYYIFPRGVLKKHFLFHESIQNFDDKKNSFFWGTFNQLIIIAAILLYLNSQS